MKSTLYDDVFNSIQLRSEYSLELNWKFKKHKKAKDDIQYSSALQLHLFRKLK